ncbi:MAG TPA: AmmeMemoRadiSam system protein B [Aeromonadales bacterium]|nr:AmmeMemoRadiSam system protein B [Aeromonadales bacterium]
MQVIKPNVAGTFYSADRRELSDAVRLYVDEASKEVISSRVKALIVPHAGYVYSGPVAGSAYAALKNQASTIQRVVLLAPSHYYGFEGMATTSADILETPLGEVKVDREAITKIEDLPGVLIANEAFNNEHALEVQLPFLQTVLTDFKVVPLIVGQENPQRVAEVLDTLWGGDETLIVVSSDLSHYLDYQTAKHKDRETAEHVLHFASEQIHGGDACGFHPLNGLLIAAREHHLKAQLLDLRNSGDTAGPKDRVVGYGAFILTE